MAEASVSAGFARGLLEFAVSKGADRQALLQRAGIEAKLAVSRQTLFRKLKAEGTTFEQVLDDLRHGMVLHYLSDKRVSVNQTAYLIGFSEPAAFSRAFKRWTGSAPSKHTTH